MTAPTAATYTATWHAHTVVGDGSTSTRPHLDARRTKITPTALHHYRGRNFQSRRQLNTDHGAAAVSAKSSRCITWATPRPISVRAKTCRSCGPNGITPFRQSSPASSRFRSWSAKGRLGTDSFPRPPSSMWSVRSRPDFAPHPAESLADGSIPVRARSGSVPARSRCATSVGPLESGWIAGRFVSRMQIVETLRERDFCADSGATAWWAVQGQRSAEGSDPVVQSAKAASHGRSGAAHAVVFDRQYEAVVGRRGYNTRGISVRVLGHVCQRFGDYEVCSGLDRWRIAIIWDL
jgi:hypothetical protein